MIDNTLDEISGVVIKILLTLAGVIAPVIVPLAPAAFAGLAVYNVVGGEIDPMLAIFIAVSGASGLELVGFIAAHTTLSLYTAYQKNVGDIRRVYIGVFIILLYLAAGVTVISQLDELTVSARAVGQGSLVLSLAVYVLTALMSDVRRMDIDAKEKENERRERLREAREERRRRREKSDRTMTGDSPISADNDRTNLDNRPPVLSKSDFVAAIKSGELKPSDVNTVAAAANYGVTDRTIRRWLEPYRGQDANGNNSVV